MVFDTNLHYDSVCNECQVAEREFERLTARIKTLTAQLAAQREVVAADDAYLRVADERGIGWRGRWNWLLKKVVTRDECTVAREAAARIDKEAGDV